MPPRASIVRSSRGGEVERTRDALFVDPAEGWTDRRANQKVLADLGKAASAPRS
jgi:hypothetical protein